MNFLERIKEVRDNFVSFVKNIVKEIRMFFESN